MPQLGTLKIDTINHSQKGTGKEYYWAGEGLCLAVTPANGKTWYKKFTISKKVYWYKIGDYPSITLKMATITNKVLTGKIIEGKNPAIEKLEERSNSEAYKNEITFEKATVDYLEFKKPNISQNYYWKISAWLKRINQFIGDKRVMDIDLPIMKKAFNDAGMKPSVSRCMFWIIKEVARQAVLNKKASSNQVYVMKIDDVFGKVERKTKHHKSLAHDGNIEDFRQFLFRVKEEECNGFNVAYLTKALIYLPIRKVEMMRRKFTDVDFESGIITISEKMNKRSYHIKQPISRQLMKIINDQKLRYPGCEYIFPGRDDKFHGHLSEPSTVKFLERTGWNDRQSIHGFRSCFKTWGKSILYLSHEVTELTIGHEIKNSIGKAYDFTDFWEDRKDGLQKWADWVDSLTEDPTLKIVVPKQLQ